MFLGSSFHTTVQFEIMVPEAIWGGNMPKKTIPSKKITFVINVFYDGFKYLTILLELIYVLYGYVKKIISVL